MTAAPRGIRSASIRVAVGATAVVAVAYLVISGAVLAIVTRNLTAQIDDQLAGAIAHIADEPAHPADDDGFEAPRPREGPFGPAQFVWTVLPNGQVASVDQSTVLPAAYRTVSGPESVTIGSASVRVRGAAVGDRYVVVGQSLAPVSDAQATILLAEIVIGPVLLVIVFLGAVAIGRRVAAPIEHARRRQLEFTADASHELRTPVSVIEAHTSLALAQDRSADWYRGAFQRIDDETRRVRRLLDDLLWLARFDALQGPPAAEPVDLGVLASQAADRFAIVAEARHLSLRVHAPSEGIVVNAPADWLDRLVGVLLDNACKYAPDGGAVDLSLAAEGGRVRMTVEDTGPGIPEDERARIFDRFHRATDSTAGSGLGLAIADAIVRATNGRWRVGSSPSGGASLSVSWPRALAGSNPHQDA